MSESKKSHRSCWNPIHVIMVVAVCAGVLAALSWGYDPEISHSVRGWDLPGDLAKAISLSEAFAHGLGALVILVCIVIVSTQRRQAVVAATVLTLVCGAAGNLAKSVVTRVRPHSIESLAELMDPQNADDVDDEADGKSSRGTEAGDRAAGVNRDELDFWDTRRRSFPSGHAATATGLAIGLSLVFPRGTLMFVGIALLSGLQRVVSGAHFPSDVLAGVALACVCSLLLLWLTPLRRHLLPEYLATGGES